MDVRDAACILWNFHCVFDELQPADVIIGLGSYDLRVATRCAQLFHDGLSDRIIFTGASGNWTSELFSESEAEAFKKQAIEEGVPENVITLEPHATNIGENIRLSAEIVPSVGRAIFVTKPQTQKRVQATAQKQWPSVEAFVTALATRFEDQPLPHHSEHALICEMVGDVERMQTYAELGFQTKITVPRPVWRAFDALVNAGFVDHLQRRPF